MLLIAGGIFFFLAGTVRAQSSPPATIDAAEQKSETAPVNFSQEKPDYSQEPYVFERFVTHAAFQKDWFGSFGNAL